MSDPYRTDLAYIHDAGFGQHARSAAPVLLQALRQRGIMNGLVVELACGSGILSAEISAAGYDILGIDIAPAMIDLARKRVPKGQFRVESYLTTKLPECVAVAAVGECFNYLFDQANSQQQIVKLFRRVHAALCPGGIFLFDIAEPGRVPGRGPRRSFVEGDDWAVLVINEQDKQRQLLTRRITSFRKVGEQYRRDEEIHRLRLYQGAELAKQLREIGFRVRILRRYGDRRFPPGYVGFLARK